MKLINKTPKSLSCIVGACPAIFETDKESYVIIGKIVNDKVSTTALKLRIGHNEIAIEVPKKLISQLGK